MTYEIIKAFLEGNSETVARTIFDHYAVQAIEQYDDPSEAVAMAHQKAKADVFAISECAERLMKLGAGVALSRIPNATETGNIDRLLNQRRIDVFVFMNAIERDAATIYLNSIVGTGGAK